MKRRLAICTLPLLAVTCCRAAPDPVPPPPVSVPATAPAPTPTPAPLPPPVSNPAYDNWLDAPQTPGDWTYRDGARLSYTTFGAAGTAARFGVECAKTTRSIRLVRGARANGAVPMRIRTETAERLITTNPSPDGRPMLIATLNARDPLLDAIALSRGRFSVETSGMETLYLPAWPEISRVIEDCR